MNRYLRKMSFWNFAFGGLIKESNLPHDDVVFEIQLDAVKVGHEN